MLKMAVKRKLAVLFWKEFASIKTTLVATYEPEKEFSECRSKKLLFTYLRIKVMQTIS